jgi:hypothetical protein
MQLVVQTLGMLIAAAVLAGMVGKRAGLSVGSVTTAAVLAVLVFAAVASFRDTAVGLHRITDTRASPLIQPMVPGATQLGACDVANAGPLNFLRQVIPSRATYKVKLSPQLAAVQDQLCIGLNLLPRLQQRGRTDYIVFYGVKPPRVILRRAAKHDPRVTIYPQSPAYAVVRIAG